MPLQQGWRLVFCIRKKGLFLQVLIPVKVFSVFDENQFFRVASPFLRVYADHTVKKLKD